MVAGIARRALSVIQEAAEITQSHRHNSSNGVATQHTSANSHRLAASNGSPTQSRAANSQSSSVFMQQTMADSASRDRSSTGQGASAKGQDEASNSQGSGSMGGGSSAIYSQGPSKGGARGDKQVRNRSCQASCTAMHNMQVCDICCNAFLTYSSSPSVSVYGPASTICTQTQHIFCCCKLADTVRVYLSCCIVA